MPELPEVETVRRDLCARGLPGARIVDVWTSGKPLRLGRRLDGRLLRATCVGRRVDGLRRRGKYILVDLDDGARLVIHLGMSGRLWLTRAVALMAPHTHVVWRLGGGRELRFVDARRFGLVAHAGDARAEAEIMGAMGIDPLTDNLDGERLSALLRGSRRAVKAFLLDQSAIAGLGNIYASEALFRARIHPLTLAGRIAGARASALCAAIVEVLRRALASGGTTLRDFTDAGGEPGGNSVNLRAYGREGQPCPRGDGGTIRRLLQQGRSTFYCPRCQRR